ncbi:MAG: tyrosine-type recombinase/integrase [Bacteroidota bacterium]
MLRLNTMKMSFDTYLKSKGHSHKTIRSEIRNLTQYQNWLKGEGIESEETSYNDLLAYMKYLNQKGITKRTVQVYINTLKHYYNHLLESKVIIQNPAQDIQVKGVKRSKLHYILAPHELHGVYTCDQDKSPNSTRNKVILGLLINQEIRSEELGKLETKDINLKAGTIRIPGTKKSNEREIELRAQQIILMNQYKEGVKREQFFEGNMNVIMSSLMYHLRKQYPTISVNQIRASVITKWLKQYNLRKTQYLAGHKYISSTEAYQKNDLER